MTLEELKSSYDWVEAFGEGSGGNTDKTTEAVGACDPSPPMLADVVEILAFRDGENDEKNWIGVFRVADGRFVYVDAGCDFTGWDCRASNSLTVAADLRSLVVMGMTDEARQEFPQIVRSALWPSSIREDAPPGIAADWLHDQGDEGAALLLRKLEATT